MTENLASILFFVVIIIIAWFSLKTLFKLVDQLTDYILHQYLYDEKWLKNAPYTTLVHQTIFYTNDILYELGIDHFPSFHVYYYRHQKYLGLFHGEIKVYTKNHKDVTDLVDTVLHEVKHFIQSETDPDFDNYNSYTKRYGMEKNPFEVEARNFASEHLEDCLLYLLDKGLIRRA